MGGTILILCTISAVQSVDIWDDLQYIPLGLNLSLKEHRRGIFEFIGHLELDTFFFTSRIGANIVIVVERSDIESSLCRSRDDPLINQHSLERALRGRFTC